VEPHIKKIIVFSLVGLVIAGSFVLFFIFRQKQNVSTVSEKFSETVLAESPDQVRIRQINLIKTSLESALKRGFVLPEPKDAIFFNF
jgi:hypothetical protein